MHRLRDVVRQVEVGRRDRGVPELPRARREHCAYTPVMWFPVEQPWQYRVLDLLPPGVDFAQLEQARQMTPTERVEAMCRLVEFAEHVQRARRSSEPR